MKRVITYSLFIALVPGSLFLIAGHWLYQRRMKRAALDG